MKTKIRQIRFQQNLAALQRVRMAEDIDADGDIIQVTIHWPAGCNALVDVRVGRDGTQFCPDDGVLALNDATPSWPFNLPVRQGGVLWVEMTNTDGVNPHNITVMVSVEEKDVN